jgi:hypothetical protein
MPGAIFTYMPIVFPASTMTLGLPLPTFHVTMPPAMMQPCIGAVYVPPPNTVTAISAPPIAKITAAPFSAPAYITSGRLNALPAGRDAPLLIRVIVPILKDLITETSGDDNEVINAVDMIVRELKTVAEGKRGNSGRFFAALEKLAKVLIDGGRSEALSAKIEDLLAEDLQRLWTDLMNSGKELVGGFTDELNRAIESGLGEREIRLRLNILKEFLHSEDTEIVIAGLSGIAALTGASPVHDRLGELAGPGLIPLLEEHFETPTSIRIRSVTELLDALWPHLGADRRIAAVRSIYGVVPRYRATRQIDGYGTLAVLDFLASHESDIPQDLLDEIKDDTAYAELLFSELPAGSDANFPRRQRNIPAYVRWTEGGEAQEHMKEGARAVIEHTANTEDYQARYKYFCALCSFYLHGADGAKKEGTLRKLAALLAEYDDRFAVSFQFLLPRLTSEGRQLIYDHAKKRFEGEVRRGDAWPRLHSVIFDRFRGVNEWQTPEALHFFDVLGEIHGIDISRLIELSRDLPRPYVSVLREGLSYLFTARNPYVRPLVLHLFKTVSSADELREIAVFFRDFGNLHGFDQEEFFKSVSADPQDEAPIPLDPAHATAGLRDFLIGRFVDNIARNAEEKAQIVGDIRARIDLWSERDLLTYLMSLSGFSNEDGSYAIRSLLENLLSPPSVSATAAAGNRRFFNPLRYRGMEGAFSLEFIGRWSNNDADRVIPLGPLDAYEDSSDDRAAVRRVNYGYTARQLALHMRIEGAKDIDEAGLYDALLEYMEGLKITRTKGGIEWTAQMTGIISKMRSAEEIDQWEVTEAIEFLKRNQNVIGLGSDEVVIDLKKLRRNLRAGALTGRAWLIITSDPAEMIGAGRMPSNCQNPMKKSSFNNSGEPVNRANEGRFLYAKIVIASDVHLESGAAVMSADAEMIARSDLEVTTESGLPDPSARPHLLVERAFVLPGFIYESEFAAAMNRFAVEELGLDPAREVHIQFTDQNMDGYPPHLADARPINRVTFR